MYFVDLETIPIQDVEEKKLEENDFEKQKLKDEISKLKDNVGNVPHHVLGKYEKQSSYYDWAIRC